MLGHGRLDVLLCGVAYVAVFLDIPKVTVSLDAVG
jgi:hypothetical protein